MNNLIRYSHIHSEKIGFGHSLSPEPEKLDPIGMKLFRHTHDKHQILIFLSGECKMTTDEYTHVLQPGDVCFNPAKTYYGVSILGNAPYERVVIHIEPNEHFESLAYSVFDDLKPINVNVKERLLPFIERYKEYGSTLSFNQFSPFAYSLLEELLCICQMEKNNADHTINTADNLLKQALAYIDSNWKTIKNVSEISNALFISPSYLYEIFNKHLNVAPKTYLMQKRLQSAHAYLISGITPNEVSQLVGFNTYTAFYRACKAFYGKAPQDILTKK